MNNATSSMIYPFLDTMGDTHYDYSMRNSSLKVLFIVKLRKAVLTILVRGFQKTIEEF
jgi:hypothetical protein